jgi:hypothetical protein
MAHKSALPVRKWEWLEGFSRFSKTYQAIMFRTKKRDCRLLIDEEWGIF